MGLGFVKGSSDICWAKNRLLWCCLRSKFAYLFRSFKSLGRYSRLCPCWMLMEWSQGTTGQVYKVKTWIEYLVIATKMYIQLLIVLSVLLKSWNRNIEIILLVFTISMDIVVGETCSLMDHNMIRLISIITSNLSSYYLWFTMLLYLSLFKGIATS